MGCYLAHIRWLTEAFEGDKFESLTLNQQMVPQNLPIWGSVGGKFPVDK